MRQQERTASTREKLLAVARELVVERGYDAVSQEEIVAGAGLTRGALYHHFDGKAGVLDALYNQAQREIAERIIAAANQEPTPWDALIAGCRVFVAASIDPAFRQIALIDAPRVLGWARWREVDGEHAMGTLIAGIRQVIASGDFYEQPIGPLVHALSGAMNELGLWVVAADDPSAALVEAQAAIERILGGLRQRDDRS